MIKASVVFDDDVFEAVYETANEAPAAMRREAGIVSRGPTAQKMIRELSAEPGPVVLPIDWTSDRQRRFVMRMRRKQGFPPRSHRISQGWRVVLLNLSEMDGIIGVENSERGVEFVQGEWQQKFHANTGWPLARTIIRGNAEALQDELIEGWYRATKAKRK